MRRFSQRSALVTLSEINITPLLDLAFVLLIIFVITTPLLEQGLPLNLPKGGAPDQRINKEDVRTIEISEQGVYTLNRRRLTLDQIEAALVQDYQADPNLVLFIRADKNGRLEDLFGLLDRCRKHGITKMDMRSFPETTRRRR